MTTNPSLTTWRGTTQGAAQTMALGAAVARAARAGDLIALIGELGAGKTQWVRGMATALGVAPTALASPTFVMVQEYSGAPGKPVLVHIDAYRLRTAEDLESIGWDAAGASQMRRGAIVVIEWADRIAGAWDPEALKVHLTHVGENERAVEITASESWAQRIDALMPELDAILKSTLSSPTLTSPITPSNTLNASAAKCPICGKPLPAAAPVPFCSERCRLIDLGKWLGGQYRISRPIEPDPNEAE